MKMFLIDGIAPFFAGWKSKRINWSKIPFHRFEVEPDLQRRRLDEVSRLFERFAARAAEFGCNAISLDDLAHVMRHSLYDSQTLGWIDIYRSYFDGFCRIASRHGLDVYLTTDVMFFHPATLPKARVKLARDVLPVLKQGCDALFRDFPHVKGVIARIGECDGRDTEGVFRSRLVLRTAEDCNRFLREWLPVFEMHDRQLIFRTWTVGAYPIGDLQWNRRTFDRAFRGLEHSKLILSMKYGESDFFRYLPLNQLFFRSSHRKILECQCRREYEGFGEFPSFVGWDYEQYARQLAGAQNLVGLSVWCQTGGWSQFRRLTFLNNSSVWNEINTYVTLRIFRDRLSTEEAVAVYARRYLPGADAGNLLTLLRLSDEVIKDLLYIEEFARRKLYFRRLRIPPLLSVYWDHILVSHAIRRLMRHYVQDGAQAVSQGYAALQKIKQMQLLAESLQLPAADFEFQYATFELLATAREYYFAGYREELAIRLHTLKKRYRATYRRRYAVHINLSPLPVTGLQLRMLLRLCFRRQRGYRILDQVVMIRLLNLLRPLLCRPHREYMPDFAGQQAMGMDTLLK